MARKFKVQSVDQTTDENGKPITNVSVAYGGNQYKKDFVLPIPGHPTPHDLTEILRTRLEEMHNEMTIEENKKALVGMVFRFGVKDSTDEADDGDE